MRVDHQEDDDRLSESERKAIPEADEWLKHNQPVPHEQVLAEFKLTTHGCESLSGAQSYGAKPRTDEQLELWIGLVELKPLDRKEFDFAGAYTDIVTWADSLDAFGKKASAIAETLDMFVAEIENAEPLASRAEKFQSTEEVDDRVRQAESDENAIVFGTFHSYPFEEA